MCRDLNGGGESCTNGQNGLNGLNGENGITPTISVGTVTSLPTGDQPFVTNTGTGTAALFNFGIPQGSDGDSIMYNHCGRVFWYDQFTKIVGAPQTIGASSGLVYGCLIRQNPGAINDQMTLFFDAPSGVYDITIIGTRSPSSGIVQWSVNGIDRGGLEDMYTASNTYYETYLLNTVLPSTGLQTLSQKVVGKNPSSSTYQVWLAKVIIKKL